MYETLLNNYQLHNFCDSVMRHYCAGLPKNFIYKLAIIRIHEHATLQSPTGKWCDKELLKTCFVFYEQGGRFCWRTQQLCTDATLILLGGNKSNTRDSVT